MSGIKIGQHRAKKTKAGAVAPCPHKGPPKKALPLPPSSTRLTSPPKLHTITIGVKCERKAIKDARVTLSAKGNNGERPLPSIPVQTNAEGKAIFRKKKEDTYSVNVHFDKNSIYANLDRPIILNNVRTDINRTIEVKKKPNTIIVRAMNDILKDYVEGVKVTLASKKSMSSDTVGMAESGYIDPGSYRVKVEVPKPDESKVEVFYKGASQGKFEPGDDIVFNISVGERDINKIIKVLVTPHYWVELLFVDSKDQEKKIERIGAYVTLPDGKRIVKNSGKDGIAKVEYSMEGKLQIDKFIDDNTAEFPEYLLEAELEK